MSQYNDTTSIDQSINSITRWYVRSVAFCHLMGKKTFSGNCESSIQSCVIDELNHTCNIYSKSLHIKLKQS